MVYAWSQTPTVIMHPEAHVCQAPGSEDRTTEGRGLICQAPLEEIRRLDAGSKHSAAFRGEQVPLLDEAAEMPKTVFADNGRFNSAPGPLKLTLSLSHHEKVPAR